MYLRSLIKSKKWATHAASNATRKFFRTFFQFLKIEKNVHQIILVSVIYVYRVLIKFECEKRAIQSCLRSLKTGLRKFEPVIKNILRFIMGPIS